MRKNYYKNRVSAQIMLEYLVMTILIAFLAFSAMNLKKPGSVGNKVMEKAHEYYMKGYQAIK